MNLLDGRIVAKIKTEELKKKVNSLSFIPKLCIIQVGDLFESNKYITNKIRKAEEVGISVNWKKFDSQVSENELILFIKNNSNYYDGLIVQLPLPKHINKQNVLDSVPLEKDVDGLSTINMKNFYSHTSDYFIPATAKAILLLLNHFNIDLVNKNMVVVGESNLVGKPIKHLLLQYSKNVTSRNIDTGINGTEEADILIVAAGCPNLIKKENVKQNSCVVDVGINTLENKQVVGDVKFDEVKDIANWISPVPGGVGPLTVISLLENIVDACIKKNNKKDL